MSETLKSLVERYSKAYKAREDAIGDFFDDEGELKAETNYARFDEARTGHWEESHGDLGSLLSELAELVGLNYQPGDRVLVLADAKTAHDGEVFFEGETEATVVASADIDGDLLVTSDEGILQFVGARHLKRLDA